MARKPVDKDFEVWAKGQHANLSPSPYPDSFRTYKHDRTQHMYEGWQAARPINLRGS